MVALAFGLRVVLASVMVLAGAAKALSPRATAAAAAQFGVPRRLAPVVALVLPLLEIALAVGLVGAASGVAASVACAALMLVFTAVVARTVATGRQVECNCFGSLSVARVTGRTVARNAVLLALAGLTAVTTVTQSDVAGVHFGQLAASTWAIAALSVAVVVLAATQWRMSVLLLEQQGRLLLRLDEVAPPAAPSSPVDGLPVGAVAPGFALPGLRGETLTLDSLVSTGRPVVLVFSDPGCGPCNELVGDVASWQREDARATVVVIAAGSLEDNRAKAAEHALGTVLLDHDRAVATAYRSPGTPSAVLIGADGRVAAPIAAGAPAVRTLMSSLPELPGTRPAPSFALTSETGERVTEAWFADRERTVVLFWNPGCGFCQRMQERLRHWDHQAQGDLLVISAPLAPTGLGLAAPVLLDDGTVTAAFGANGTPMALTVDATGRITSSLAAGEEAVFDLLGPVTADPGRLLPLIPGGGA